jgi:hypothetical protein
VLGFVAAPDYENPQDAGLDNTYDVTVRVSDGSLTDDQDLSISVGNVNEAGVGAVTDVDSGPNQVAENAGNGTMVGVTAFATDADAGDSVTYSLDNDAGGRFAIDAVTGIVSVANGSLLDYESATGHAIVVRTSSSDGSATTLALNIQLGNLNDVAPALNLQTLTIDQGVAATLTPAIDATDADGVPPALTFSVGNVVAGRIESTLAPGVAITGFAQSDLVAGRIRFVQDGSGTTPGFEVSVSDSVHTAGPQSALIQFRPAAVVPGTTSPVTATPAVPPSGSGPVTSAGPVTPSVTPGAASSGSATAGPADASSPGRIAGSDPGVALLQEALLVNVGAFGNAAVQNPGSLSISLPEAPVGLTRDLPTFAVNLLDQLRLELSSYAQAGSGPGGANRFEAATTLPDGPQDKALGIEVAMDAARLAGITFSVGAVWWALRVGGLMASLFASAPAWRQFDPLPILRNKEDKDDTGRWLEEDITPDARDSDEAGMARRDLEVLLQ